MPYPTTQTEPEATEEKPRPCPCCGRIQWWTDGERLVCGVCHPSPTDKRSDQEEDIAPRGHPGLPQAVWEWGKANGFPVLQYAPHLSVVAGATGWRTFASRAGEDNLRLIREWIELREADRAEIGSRSRNGTFHDVWNKLKDAARRRVDPAYDDLM